MANILLEPMWYPQNMNEYAPTANPGWDVASGVFAYPNGRFAGQKAAVFLGSGSYFLPTAQSEFYVGWATLSPAGAGDHLYVYNGGTVAITVAFTAIGHFVIKNSANTIVATSASTFASSKWWFLELYVKIDATVGVFELRVNNTVVCTFNGATNGGGSTVNNVRWSGGGGALPVQDIYINDTTGADARWNTYLGDSTWKFSVPNANGSTINFTPSAGSNWQNVDDPVGTTDGDATYNYSSTVNDTDLYQKEAITLLTGQDVLAVQMSVIVRKTDVGDRRVKLVMKSGATTDVSGNEELLSTNYAMYRRTFLKDPNTSANWVLADVNSAEIGLRITT